MTPPDRIALLLPDVRFGGAERVNVNLANEFVSRGSAVDMVLMKGEGELMPLLDSRVRIIDLGVSRMLGLFGPLASYLRRERPIGMIANMWPLTAVAVAAARWTGGSGGTRVVVVEHNNWTRQAKSDGTALRWVRKLSMRSLFPLAAARIGVSRGVTADLERHAHLASGSVRCIYNPVTGGTRQARSAGIDPSVTEWFVGNHRKILSVGVLQSQKRFDWLIEAFARLDQSQPARLLILGDGPERAELEALVDRLNLKERVFMPGFANDPTPYYAAADLFVVSSEYEGLSLVLIEALEQGTPAVSMDCPSGPREILDDGKHGLLVPVGDIGALAEGIGQALARSHDSESLKARAEDFSVAKAADAYLRLLVPDQLCSGGVDDLKTESAAE